MLQEVFVSQRALLQYWSRIIFSASQSRRRSSSSPERPDSRARCCLHRRVRNYAAFAKDVEFMQGMIMHHAQAVEMVALMADAYSEKRSAVARRLVSAVASQTK
jgi:uncharacterized protein (DUF305 family)